MRGTLALATLLFVQLGHACPIGKTGLSSKDLEKVKKQNQARAQERKKEKRNIAQAGGMPILPSLETSDPWGGSNPEAWKNEAVLTNAVSRALNEGWAKPGIEDVMVSVPLTMVSTGSEARVYGDGQTNATMHFSPSWPHKTPQLVASLLVFKGKRQLQLRFSSKLDIKTPEVTIVSYPAGTTQKDNVKLDREEGSNDLKATWDVPSALTFGNVENAYVLWVTIKDWNHSFPLDFRFPIYKIDTLAKAAGSAKTAGKSPLDPLGIRERVKKNGTFAQAELMNTNFSEEWLRVNGSPILPNDSIHGEVKGVKTAVGGGYTSLVLRGQNSTFKNLYSCFDPRNLAAESTHGVPSGGGWHEIGDAAETILNNLEDGPVLVGYASGAPQQNGPDGKGVAFDNKDIATYRLLRPGEAMTTRAGNTTWKEDADWRAKRDGSQRGKDKSGAGRNYHTFSFTTPKDHTCAQIWVHPCLPTETNRLGLEPKNDPANCNLNE